MNICKGDQLRLVSALCMAVALTTPASVGALELYDTFRGERIDGLRGRLIDPAKWDPWTSHAAMEVQRVRSGGKVVLRSVTYGDTSTSIGRLSGRATLAFPEAIAQNLTEIRARVQTRSVAVTGCSANSGEASRILSPRIGGYWFRDNTPISSQLDQEGNVWASIDVLRMSDDDAITDPADRRFPFRNELRRGNRLLVVAEVNHCADFDCLTGDRTEQILGIIKRGQARHLSVRWDELNNRFGFRFHRGDEVFLDYEPSLNNQEPPLFWKRIEHRGQPQNCVLADPDSSSRPATQGEVRIFDVHVTTE